MIDMRSIETFVAVATAGSFTRAAARLRVSQSAVSQRIRLIEAEVGEPLLLRTSRRVRLSGAGEDLLPIAQEILRGQSLLLAKREKGLVELRGRLTLGASAAATAYLWARMCHAFAQKYPRVDLDIRSVARTEDTMDQVASGDLDVGYAVLPVNRPGIGSRALGFNRATLVAPPGHELASGRRIDTARLRNERFILYERGLSIRWLSEHFFERERLKPKVILESNDPYLIKALVQVGFGIAFLAAWCIERELQEKQLRTIFLPGPALAQDMGLIFKARDLSPAARVFIDFCAANVHLLPAAAQRGK